MKKFVLGCAAALAFALASPSVMAGGPHHGHNHGNGGGGVRVGIYAGFPAVGVYRPMVPVYYPPPAYYPAYPVYPVYPAYPAYGAAYYSPGFSVSVGR